MRYVKYGTYQYILHLLLKNIVNPLCTFNVANTTILMIISTRNIQLRLALLVNIHHIILKRKIRKSILEVIMVLYKQYKVNTMFQLGLLKVDISKCSKVKSIKDIKNSYVCINSTSLCIILF